MAVREPDLDDLLTTATDALALPGLAYAVVAEGEVICSGGIGDADVAAGLLVDTEFAFPIASITKLFTALLVMQLVEERRLTLDQPVNDFLSSFEIVSPRRTPEVTLRHLLTHTAGIGGIRRWSDFVRPSAPPPAGPLGARFAPRLHTDRTVGRKWAYSNHGYMALAALVEDVTGERFADRLRNRLFDPLDMPRSAIAPEGRLPGPSVTRYKADDTGALSPVATELDEPGAGGICAPVDELINFLVALTGGDAQVGTETLADMMRPHVAYEGIGGMGLGFQCVELDGIEMRGHSGNTDGASSGLLVAPDHRVGAVVMTNIYTLAMPGLAAKLLLEVCGPPAETRSAGVRRHPDVRGPYRPLPGLRTNLQTWAYLGGEIDILESDGRLELRGATPLGPFGRPIALSPTGEPSSELVRYRLEVEGVPLVAAFVFGRRGVSHLNFGGLLGYFSFRRRPRLTALRIVVAACAALALVGLVVLIRLVAT